MLSSLKSAEKAVSTVSHETRLGMAVISILFCAFCFLVYHKMDLHEKQRQLASIQPHGSGGTAEPVETTGGDAAVISMKDPQPDFSGLLEDQATEIIDPIMNVADLSDGSPFSDPEMTSAELLSDSTPATNEFAADMDSGFASDGSTNMYATTESVTENAQATGSFDAGNFEPDYLESGNFASNTELVASNEPEADIPHFGFDEPVLTEPVLTEPVLKEPVLTEKTKPEDTQEFATGAITDQTPAFANLDTTVRHSAESSEAFSATSPQDQASSAFGSNAPVRTSADTGSHDLPDSRDLADSSAFGQNPSPASEPVFPNAFEPTETPAVQPRREPILLAMTEPQQGQFSGGFSTEDPILDSFAQPESNPGINAGLAPAEEPSDPFAGFDSAPTPKTTEAKTPTRQQSTPFGNNGLQAITQPSGRSRSNAVRTAGGSGADGRFSLAAFNYQNDHVAPAPDDGSTFDSARVEDGDNYSKISKRVYGTSRYFSALAVFNQHRIPEPKNMRPGMIVLTPPKELLEERYPQLFADMQPKRVEPAEFLVLDDGSAAYRVGERETLSEISQRFLGRSSRWIEIYRLNQNIVPDPNRLKPGIILALPADATEVHVAP